MTSVFDHVEKRVGNEGNAGLSAHTPLPEMFSQAFFIHCCKTPGFRSKMSLICYIILFLTLVQPYHCAQYIIFKLAAFPNNRRRNNSQ